METKGGIRPKWSKKRAARNAAVRVVPILLGSLFLNSQATAQSVNVPDEQGGASRVDEIVVTAQKRAESLQDVPIAITAVSGSALEERNITQPQQLTLIDPSVRFRTSLSSNTSALAIRGIGTSVFSPGIEQSISTVVDGVVYAVPASLSTLNDIERVEILRGPQGMLFGKNASGGLVHFVTKRPRIGDNSGSIRLQFGSRGEEALSGVANIAVGDNAAFRVAVARNRKDGLVRNVARDRKLEDGIDVDSYSLKFLWQPTDGFSAYILADRTDNDGACCTSTYRAATPGFAPVVTAARAGITPGPRNMLVNSGGPVISDSRTQGVSLQLDYDIGDHSLASITAYREFRSESFNDGDGTSVNYIDMNGGRNNVKWFTQELRLTSPVGERFDYVAGLYFFGGKTKGLVRQRGQLQWIVPASNGIVIPVIPGAPAGTIFDTSTFNDIDTRSYAAFGQAVWHVTDRLDIIAGGRWTHDRLTLDYLRPAPPTGSVQIPGAVAIALNQSVRNDNFSWRIGPRFDFSDELMGYFTISRGYKGPGFSGLSAANTLADQRVQPEIPTSLELGLKFEGFDRRLTANLAIYRNVVKDFQAQVANLSSPTYSTRITNAGKIKVKGAELSLAGRPTNWLRLFGNVAYTDGHYADFNGVQCYFGQPKVVDGGKCSPPPALPNSVDGFFNAAGLPLASTPKWSYSLGAHVETAITSDVDLFAQADWNGQSDINFSVSNDPKAVQKAYGVFGGRVGIAVPNHNLRFSLYASNLFDKRYVANIAPSPVTALNPGGYIQFFSPDSVRRVGFTMEASF